MDPVHTAKRFRNSKKSPEIQQNSGLFCFQTLQKIPLKSSQKRLIPGTLKTKENIPLLQSLIVYNSILYILIKWAFNSNSVNVKMYESWDLRKVHLM